MGPFTAWVSQAGVRPVVRTDGGPWQRVGACRVAGRALDGRVLTFDTGAGCNEAETAFCYPYGPEDLEGTLAACGEVWNGHDLGLTGAGRPLPRLRSRTPGRGRPAAVAYVTARQHAGETPGSWVLDGLLRAVAEADATGPLRQVEWWAAPFVDLDGAIEGNYGKDALPWDFNRAWAQMPMRPEVLTIQRDMRRFARRALRRIVVDLHGPAAAEHGLYQFVCRDEGPPEQREAQLSFSPYLVAEFPDVDAEQLVRVPRYPSRWNALETITSWVWHGLDNTVGVSIETAYQSLDGRNWLNPEGYRGVGRRIARAVAGWLLEA